MKTAALRNLLAAALLLVAGPALAQGSFSDATGAVHQGTVGMCIDSSTGKAVPQTVAGLCQGGILVDTNSSAAPLGVSGVFTGATYDGLSASSYSVSVFSNVASATDGLSIQQSSDGTNWDLTDTYTVPAATGKVFVPQKAARYMRVVYTNGGTLQTSFRLQVIANSIMQVSMSQRPSDTISNDNDFSMTMATSMIWDGATNWLRQRGSAAFGAYSDLRGINGVAPLAGNGVTGTGSARVTIASDSSAIAVKGEGATGAAVPAGAQLAGARSGANMVALIQANASVPINVATATTTQLVALSGTTVIYVTSFDVVSAGTGNITFVYGTGAACGTGTVSMTGPYNLAAQGHVMKGSGLGPVLIVPAGNALCVTTSAAIQMSGSVSYTQF